MVTDVGSAVSTLRPGMSVIAPFSFADGGCVTCCRGLPSGCAAGGMFGVDDDSGQAEAVRVPFADVNLVAVAMDENDERLPSFLALSDVMATGLHAVRSGEVAPGSSVAIVGDGPVGLCAVLAARDAGAARMMLPGQARVAHPHRQALRSD
ncbi:alcohol dehydrogenase catalytic domain-containing protein [Lentzea flava]|uniref:Uncharacterized protein n=1 Tax=Lentzea flava TaxID=103732 RepID=A0ABQ2VEV1_9PSEU|nr:alcohol dehydrogenase catalytic domain-containing protein [Lentzea flava]GGU81513.1 hypothetical protein GCM10010178_85250 [Lentzea flava]